MGLDRVQQWSPDDKPLQKDEEVIFANQISNATLTSSDMINTMHKGAIWIVNFDPEDTAPPPRRVLRVQYKDPISSNYFDLFASAVIAGTQTTAFSVYPGIATINGVKANCVLPRTYRVMLDVSLAGSCTVSVSETKLH